MSLTSLPTLSNDDNHFVTQLTSMLKEQMRRKREITSDSQLNLHSQQRHYNASACADTRTGESSRRISAVPVTRWQTTKESTPVHRLDSSAFVDGTGPQHQMQNDTDMTKNANHYLSIYACIFISQLICSYQFRCDHADWSAHLLPLCRS